jgi:glutaredoxin-related protein
VHPISIPAEVIVNDKVIYTSKSTAKSLWQEYRVCEDCVEFDTRFGKLTIPFDHVERVEISESEVRGLLRGDLHLRNFRPALKLDWANFLEHVVVDKNKGHIRRILFTPDDLEAFKGALESALNRYRQRWDAGDR